jgi:hypothetical protein
VEQPKYPNGCSSGRSLRNVKTHYYQADRGRQQSARSEQPNDDISPCRDRHQLLHRYKRNRGWMTSVKNECASSMQRGGPRGGCIAGHDCVFSLFLSTDRFLSSFFCLFRLDRDLMLLNFQSPNGLISSRSEECSASRWKASLSLV